MDNFDKWFIGCVAAAISIVVICLTLANIFGTLGH